MELEGDPNFQLNVFVNCPFDEAYEPLKKALLYTIVALGFRPRIATERADSGEQRVSKICQLIQESAYSIHDLSRIKSKAEGEFSRMNMPFELGADYGCRQFAPEKYGAKQFLIIGTRQYDYMRALSDLSGVDIQSHSDKPRVLIRKIRHWFVTATGNSRLIGPSALWYDYGDFNADLYEKLISQGFSDEDINELPIIEYLDYVQRWLDAKVA